MGNFGEFGGAIAVVVTLFYLATQTRHSADATKAMVRQGVGAGIVAYGSLTIDPRTLIEARIKAGSGELLSELEPANDQTNEAQ